MTKMTNQEYFDVTVQGLREQGEPAYNGSTCKYRYTNPQGKVLKCAAGLHISDEEYRPEMEGKLADTLFCLSDKGTPDLRYDLQKVHDAATVGATRLDPTHDVYRSMYVDNTSDTWLGRCELGFRYLAKKYNINYTAP